MNISMYTTTWHDQPPVAVNAHQLGQLINGAAAPRLDCWERFCKFFMDLVCCACGGSRRASEAQLREIYTLLHVRRAEEVSLSEDEELSEFFTTVERLIGLTEASQRNRYHVTCESQGDKHIICFCCGSHQVAERVISDHQMDYLLDHDLVRLGTGSFRLVLPLENEAQRCARMGDYGLMHRAVQEKERHGGRLQTQGGSSPPLPRSSDGQICASAPRGLGESPSGLLGGEFSLPNQRRTLSVFGAHRSCCVRLEEDPNFLPQSVEPRLTDCWQEIEGSVRAFGNYYSECCNRNFFAVEEIVEKIISRVAEITLGDFDALHEEARNIIYHAEQWGVEGDMDEDYIGEVKVGLFFIGKCCFLRSQGEGVQVAGYFDAASKLFPRGLTDGMKHPGLRGCLDHLRLIDVSVSGGREGAMGVGSSEGAGAEEGGGVGGAEGAVLEGRPAEGGERLPRRCWAVLHWIWEGLDRARAGQLPAYNMPEDFGSCLQQLEQLVKESVGQTYHLELRGRLEDVYKNLQKVLKGYWQEMREPLEDTRIPSNQADFDGVWTHCERIETAVNTWPGGRQKREAEETIATVKAKLMALSFAQQQVA